jgi:hypothetical protein
MNSLIEGNFGHYATYKECLSHLSKLHVSWVPSHAAIRVLVARVTDQLWVPHPEVVPTIRSLREHRDRWPETEASASQLGWPNVGT